MCLGSERRQHSLLLHTLTTQRLGQVSDVLWTHISRGKKGHRSVCLLLAPIRGGGEAGSLGDARVWQLRTPARTLGRACDCTLGTATWPELGRKHPERAGRQARCTRRGPPSIWGPGSSAVSLSPRLHLEHNPEATQSGNQAEEISLLRSEWAGPGNVPRAFHPGLTHRAMWPAPHGKDRGEATGQSGPPAPPAPRSGERVQGPRPRGRRSLKLCCQRVPGGNAGQGEPPRGPGRAAFPGFP